LEFANSVGWKRASPTSSEILDISFGSMSDIAILVENVSKRYLVGHQSVRRESYTTLRDVIGREIRSFARKAADLWAGRQIVQGDNIEEFWALKDVSFQVKQGEVVGIIGRNGAGKSTLLKILSRITEPTAGRAVLRGRIASLLEVGTGFHPELTGRENIFLNGAILGMSRAEIRQRFDDIVEFAEIARFLDTPVKHYSSGMYVRLAFAVAAHLEPEILVVDEVLAVGDAEFQKKCLAKMENESRLGRTVLFVSHNMAALEKLCSTAILLDAGQIVGKGPIQQQIESYLSMQGELVGQAIFPRSLSNNISLLSFKITPGTIHPNDKVSVSISLKSRVVDYFDDMVLLFFNQQGFRVAIADLRLPGQSCEIHPNRPFTLNASVKIPFVEGIYYAGIYMQCGDCKGDFLNLGMLRISPISHGLNVYEARWRGAVELEYTVSAVISDQNSTITS
jgi:lipopolysaccharide transport system ATP-binding protein